MKGLADLCVHCRERYRLLLPFYGVLHSWEVRSELLPLAGETKGWLESRYSEAQTCAGWAEEGVCDPSELGTGLGLVGFILLLLEPAPVGSGMVVAT